eukprot:2323668-Rhodomonas_salina.1
MILLLTNHSLRECELSPPPLPSECLVRTRAQQLVEPLQLPVAIFFPARSVVEASYAIAVPDIVQCTREQMGWLTSTHLIER